MIAGIITTANQLFTVAMGGSTICFKFFSFFEIGTGLLIIYFAITWKQEAKAKSGE